MSDNERLKPPFTLPVVTVEDAAEALRQVNSEWAQKTEERRKKFPKGPLPRYKYAGKHYPPSTD